MCIKMFCLIYAFHHLRWLEQREWILIIPDMQELAWKPFLLQFSLDLAVIDLLSKALTFAVFVAFIHVTGFMPIYCFSLLIYFFTIHVFQVIS